MRKIFPFIFFLLCLFSLAGYAQVSDVQRKYTAYDMRSNGKIYVVVLVVLIILIGLILYLIRIDRRISRMEKASGK
ncbi:MAG TPA: hypothetical protein VK543_03625 [Puia sp.]|nr:hypothetical protein [Puia sp.]